MARTVSLELLKSIQIASPCPANWDQMTGDDRSRFCGQCQLNVYNIASMTADEAADLITKREGRLCIRLYRREDGTVLTKDCPVGWRLIRRRTVRAASRMAAAAVLQMTGGLTVATGTRDSRTPRLKYLQPFTTIRQWLSPIAQQPVIPMGRMLAGDVCFTPPPPAPASKGGKP
jgi:hypothetical protein